MEARQLTVDEATSSVMTIVKEATTEDRLLFKQWIGECLLNMGPVSSWRKACVINPKDGSFRKPSDLSATIDIALFDASDSEVPFNFILNSPARIHPDRFVVNATIPSIMPTMVDLSEDIYYFHLGGSGSSSVIGAKLVYLAMPVDREGFPYIPESNLDAYKMYCNWMWSLRERSSQSSIAQAYQMWLQERSIAKGKNKMPDEMRTHQAFRKYLSMISNLTPNAS
jgi:hypothetical protein